MANTNTKKPEDELVSPTLPDIDNINKNALNAASANLSAARGALNNMSYDTFKQGTLYDGLKKSYEQQGKKAMQDTLGQVAARTGGMASSYATSAANQSYNNYMQTLEDAARAMYNDEYSKARDKVDLAQQGYNNAYGEYRDNVGDAWNKYNAEYNSYWDTKNYNYKVGRDTKEDNDKAREDEIDMISSDAYYGNAVSWEEYLKDHPNTQLNQSDYESIVNAATGKRTNDNRTNVDKEFESIFGAEGFDWNNYDWNGDGTIDTTETSADFDFSGSSYGEAYWRQFSNDKQQGYADADTKEAQENAVADINARIANGESLEEIAKAYKIDGTTNTWESVTGMSQAEIEQKIVEKMTPNSLWALLGSGDAFKSIWTDGKYDNTPYSNYFNKEYGPTAYEDFKSALYDLAYRCNYKAVVEFLEKYPDMADDALRFFDTVSPTAFKGNGENVTGLINSDAYKEWTRSLNNQEAQDSAVDDINARIANGESLEEIAEAYKIDETKNTWESVTGMSQAEWQQIYNDNKIGSYIYQGEKGAAAIASRAIFGYLDPNEQENFDYLYGPGAYNTVQSAKTVIGNLPVYDEQSLNDPQTTDKLDNAIASLMMIGFDDTQIANLIKAANPTLEEIYFKPEKTED